MRDALGRQQAHLFVVGTYVPVIVELGLVYLEVIIVIVRLVLVGVHAHLVRIVAIRYGGIDSYLPILLMIDGAYFESVLRAAE